MKAHSSSSSRVGEESIGRFQNSSLGPFAAGERQAFGSVGIRLIRPRARNGPLGGIAILCGSAVNPGGGHAPAYVRPARKR
jgi:hypothetical protein